jgi:hypothetical protein
MTSLNLPGFSLTLLLLPREPVPLPPSAAASSSSFAVTSDLLVELFDAPTEAPAWKWSFKGEPEMLVEEGEKEGKKRKEGSVGEKESRVKGPRRESRPLTNLSFSTQEPHALVVSYGLCAILMRANPSSIRPKALPRGTRIGPQVSHRRRARDHSLRHHRRRRRCRPDSQSRCARDPRRDQREPDPGRRRRCGDGGLFRGGRARDGRDKWGLVCDRAEWVE